MLRIGLTGGFACGKSTVANYFAELGITVIDADIIARETTTDPIILKTIVNHFDKNILDDKNNINRSKLREIIFMQPSEREWLENLLHPLIIKKMLRQAEQTTSPYCILVIPLLLEKNLQHLIDRILVIDAPDALQYQRAQQRDHLSAAQLDAILKTQASREQRLAQADDIITNDGNLGHLKQQVVTCHQHYLQRAKHQFNNLSQP